MRITRENSSEIRPYVFVTEASTLGLGVGTTWPNVIETDLGNGHPFIMDTLDPENGARYKQELGCILLAILND